VGGGVTAGTCDGGRQPQWILLVAYHEGQYTMKQLHVQMDAGVVGAYSV
jgi:hypothetical protein